MAKRCSCSCACPLRLVIGIMIFLALMVMYMLRSDFSINMLAMVNEFDENGTMIQKPDYGDRYNWTKPQQSLALGAYFYGYAITSIPLGILTDRYNIAAEQLAVAYAISILITVAVPWAACSVHAVIAMWLTMGLAVGGVAPAVNKIVSKWSPVEERSKFVAAFFGCDIGMVLTWILCGQLIEYNGWRWAFWMPGWLAAVFTVLWVYVVHNSPADHPWVSAAEREYIERSLQGMSTQQRWPPFGRMLKSPPFYALMLMHYGHMWGMYTLMTAAPMFLNTALKFDIKKAGILSGLPYLVRMVMGIVFGVCGDYVESRRLLRPTQVRKFASILSHIMPGVMLLLMPLVGARPYACVALMTVSFFFNGAVSLTNYRNMQDLAPNFASTVYSITNAVATTSGFLSPLVVAYFTREHNTTKEWSYVFMVGAAMYIVPSLFFIVFGSAEIQPWNDDEPAKKPLADAAETAEVGAEKAK